MYQFKCKMCGGALDITNETVATCEYCGTQQTLPKLSDDRRANLYDRANHFRRNNEFDKAMGIYEQILNEDNTDAESYWSLVLCRYGIEYVEDPASRKRIPTVNRAQYTAIFDDDNYRSALKYADSAQRTIYQQEARAINEIQKGILEISQKEEPFDVFICYKETDHNGRRTPDSVLANELYHQLTQEGFKVFFSRITLEDKLGVAYEPYIFAALNSAKVMVVLGTKPVYFNAVWVKNEWSRYLALIKNGAAKILIPAYRDMDPYDLPDEFSHLQAQDMSRLGFMQDLIRGIKKITQTDAPKQTVIKETVIASGNANTAPLLKRAFMFLEDGDWTSANEYCEKVLDIDPECAEAYLGKMMAELQVCKQEELKNCAQPFAGINYQKILRFGDDTLRNKLAEDIAFINERNENARLEEIYRRACESIYMPKSEEAYKTASKLFGSILGYKDAAERREECIAELMKYREKQEEKRKNEIYDKGKQMMTIHLASNYLRAIELFKQIPDWKDAAELIRECKREISSIEEQKLEAAKKRKRVAVFVVSVLCAALILALVWFEIIVPAIQYKNAMSLYEAGNYTEAISAFEALDGYKDSAQKIQEAKDAINLAIKARVEAEKAEIEAQKAKQYESAEQLLQNRRYDDAISGFLELSGYRDSAERVKDCKYEKAIDLANNKKYAEAIALCEEIKGYEGVDELICDCKYNEAITWIESKEYILAYEQLVGLGTYRDSKEMANSIVDAYKWMKITTAKVGDIISFGEYEQDNILSNGKENIEWIVLEKNNKQILVLSLKALDCQPYNTTKSNVAWQNCSLRRWLNNTFINDAFAKEEKAKIPITTVYGYYWNGGSGNKTTDDQIFLLSQLECKQYLETIGSRCTPTEYAISKGVDVSRSYCHWWLRRPQEFAEKTSGTSAPYVDEWGDTWFGKGVNTSWIAVRPAMWIDLSDSN